jgi:hypothetical protein
MPCPLFEPRTKAIPQQSPPPRLPLIYEFEGICHAGESAVSPEHRFHYCNQGNAKGACTFFPADLSLSALRYTVTRVTPAVLTVLVIEEEDHWPRSCNAVEFIIAEHRLHPEINDVPRRAQLFHFCLSYLEKANAR